MIKPRDIVRTPTGRTAVVLELNHDGTRMLRDLVNGQLYALRPEVLYLVSAAVPKPWPSYNPGKP